MDRVSGGRPILSKDKATFAAKLKQIWLQPDVDSARSYGESMMDEYESRYPEAMRILEDGLEDSLQFYSFKQIDHRKISSTNMLERLNREANLLRRRVPQHGLLYPIGNESSD